MPRMLPCCVRPAPRCKVQVVTNQYMPCREVVKTEKKIIISDWMRSAAPVPGTRSRAHHIVSTSSTLSRGKTASLPSIKSAFLRSIENAVRWSARTSTQKARKAM